MTTVYVKTGDITKAVSVDAIVTLINPGGMWWGGLDNAIMHVAGTIYHSQARAIPLTDGQVVVAKRHGRQHSGSFNDVLFVVDDLRLPLSDLMFSALRETQIEGYRSIAFPMMRTGVMLGAFEPNIRAVVEQMRAAIDKFTHLYPDSDLKIYIVVYNDPEAENILLEDGSMVKI